MLAAGGRPATIQGMKFDLVFARDYSLALAEDLDSFSTCWEFPSGCQVDPATVGRVEQTVTWSLRGGPEVTSPAVVLPDPVCVVVNSVGAPSWLGVFHPILTSARDTNAAVALPDGETFAVLSHGTGYRVWVEDPQRWEEIAAGGVHDPIVSSELGIVVFAGHTVLTGYGPSGLVWESERLVWDDLRPVRLDGETLQMEGFDAPRNEIVSFTVDVRSGRSTDAPHPDRQLRSADGPV